MRRTCIVLIFFVLSVLCAAFAQGADFNALCRRCVASTAAGDNRAAVLSADSLLQYTQGDSSSFARFTALAYAAQAYLSADEYSSAYRMINEGLHLWNRHADSEWYDGASELASVPALFNSAGVYYISAEMDYEKATEYFIRGMEFSRDNGLDQAYQQISYNLIMAYNVREEPSGLKYAEEIYQKGLSDGNLSLVCMGAYGAAVMCYHNNDLENAENYIIEAMKTEIWTETSLVYNIYGMISDAMGNHSRAESMFRKALDRIDDEPSTSASYVCLSYGKFLNNMGRYHDAIKILNRGLSIAAKKNNKVFVYRIYEALSDSYSGIGDFDDALFCYRCYHRLSDSIFNISKERNINELTIKYKTALKESEIRRKDVELLKKNHALELSLFIIVLALAAFAVTYVLYRNKNRMYTKIARQYKDAIDRQRMLDDMNSRACLQLDRDRSDEIISKFEDLMIVQKVFCDPTLSRDKLADMIGTNRTYLSKVVNEKYGKSVSQLISMYRVNRAVELLSRPDSDMQMKAVEVDSGFSSSSNFFRVFKDQVGMSPAKFREKILEISMTDSSKTASESTKTAI